jgi:hypothetical protein
MAKLTAKEQRRACGNIAVLVRPARSRGGYTVEITVGGEPWLKAMHVKTKREVTGAVRDSLRMVDKCGFISAMAQASRHRERGR